MQRIQSRSLKNFRKKLLKMSFQFLWTLGPPTHIPFFWIIGFFIYKALKVLLANEPQHKGLLTPRNIFFSESNPAAYIRAVYGGLRSTRMRQANRDIVLCGTTDISDRWSPGIVSMTTKSIGDSDDRPIWNMSTSWSGSYWTMMAWPRLSVNDTECWLLFWINWGTEETVTSGWAFHDWLRFQWDCYSGIKQIILILRAIVIINFTKCFFLNLWSKYVIDRQYHNIYF